MLVLVLIAISFSSNNFHFQTGSGWWFGSTFITSKEDKGEKRVYSLTIDWVDCSHQAMVTHNNAVFDSITVRINEVAVMFGRFRHKLGSPLFSA